MHSPSESSVEELQSILQKDLGRRVSKKDARKFGAWLLGFYAHLGAQQKGTVANADDSQQLTSGTSSKNNK